MISREGTGANRFLPGTRMAGIAHRDRDRVGDPRDERVRVGHGNVKGIPAIQQEPDLPAIDWHRVQERDPVAIYDHTVTLKRANDLIIAHVVSFPWLAHATPVPIRGS